MPVHSSNQPYPSPGGRRCPCRRRPRPSSTDRQRRPVRLLFIQGPPYLSNLKFGGARLCRALILVFCLPNHLCIKKVKSAKRTHFEIRKTLHANHLYKNSVLALQKASPVLQESQPFLFKAFQRFWRKKYLFIHLERVLAFLGPFGQSSQVQVGQGKSSLIKPLPEKINVNDYLPIEPAVAP